MHPIGGNARGSNTNLTREYAVLNTSTFQDRNLVVTLLFMALALEAGRGIAIL